MWPAARSHGKSPSSPITVAIPYKQGNYESDAGRTTEITQVEREAALNSASSVLNLRMPQFARECALSLLFHGLFGQIGLLDAQGLGQADLPHALHVPWL